MAELLHAFLMSPLAWFVVPALAAAIGALCTVAMRSPHTTGDAEMARTLGAVDAWMGLGIILFYQGVIPGGGLFAWAATGQSVELVFMHFFAIGISWFLFMWAGSGILCLAPQTLGAGLALLLGLRALLVGLARAVAATPRTLYRLFARHPVEQVVLPALRHERRIDLVAAADALTAPSDLLPGRAAYKYHAMADRLDAATEEARAASRLIDALEEVERKRAMASAAQEAAAEAEANLRRLRAQRRTWWRW